MDRDPGGLPRVASSLRSDEVRLLIHWFSDKNVTVLKDDGGVAEYEVDGAVNVTFSIELSERMGVESVLVAFEAASIEGG